MNEETILNNTGYLIPKNSKWDIASYKKELTVEPLITFNIGPKTDKKFSVYRENNDYLIVPKYYGLEKIGPPTINQETIGSNININFKGSLRPLQETIIDTIIPHITNKDGGVLCLPCAAGKTVLSLYLISKFKVKTLIIVHKTFLLEQWKERAKEFTDAKIGILQQNKIEIEGNDIVIGMLQSIAKDKYDSSIFKEFGMVIFDEAHHAPSEYFSKALPIISCKKTIGLSATPKRTDKLEKVLYWFFGDIMYKSDVNKNEKVLVNIVNYMIEHPKFCELKLYTGDTNRAGTLNKITTIGRRNKLIIDLIEEILNKDILNKRKIIVLSDRILHLQLLKRRFDKRNLNFISDFYIGGMKQDKLNIAEKANVIFATYGMASEALDIPDLNTLFMATPRKEVEQAVGRILRKINPDVQPTIYDFVDQLPSFINQGRVRKSLYNKMGFKLSYSTYNDNVLINNNNNDSNNNNYTFKFK